MVREELSIALTLEGDYESFKGDAPAQEALLADVAREMGVALDNVYLGSIDSGSIIAEVCIVPNDGGVLQYAGDLEELAKELKGKTLASFECKDVLAQVITRIVSPEAGLSGVASQQADITGLRADIAQLEARTQASISNLESSTQADIAELKTEQQTELAILRSDHEKLDNRHDSTSLRQTQLLSADPLVP